VKISRKAIQNYSYFLREFQRQIQGILYFKNKREKMLEKILQGAYHKKTEILQMEISRT